MKRIFTLFLAWMACHSYVHAQINGQTPQSGLSVCANGSTLTQGVVPSYNGPGFPGGNCLAAGARNPYWYIFTVNCTGNIGFTITPNNLGDDYDFVAMNITGLPASSVFTNAPVLSCNYSGYTGITGATPTGTGNNNGANGPNTNALIPVTPGMTIALCVSHYDNTVSGYSLAFTGGSCGPGTAPAMTFSGIDATCSNYYVEADIDRSVECSSIAANGSDFYLMPGNIAVPAAAGVGCGSASFTNKIKVTMPAGLAYGSYTLHVKTGTDGNSLLDVCGDPFATGNNIGFTVGSNPPAVITGVFKEACNPRRLGVKLSRKIKCTSLAANGSDFSITGAAAYSITAATATCTSGLSDSLVLTLNTPIVIAGSYTLYLKSGADGNILLDACDQASVLDTIALGNIQQGVTPAFTLTPASYCEDEGITITNQSFGATTYNWNMGDGTTATGATPAKVYATPNTYNIKLVVSNAAGCKDSITKQVVIKPKPTMGFQVSDSAQCLVGNSFVLTNTTNLPGGTSTYAWQLGDGATDGGTNVTHSYAAVNTYTIKLIATGSNGCIDSLTKNVTVKPMPAIPVVTTPVSFCQFSVPTALAATRATGGTLNWYPSATGGLGDTAAPTPLTTTPGVYKWYVSQTVDGCESDRDSITVIIIEKPVVPLVTTPVSYCQYNTAAALVASALPGGTLNWYTVATGGTAVASAPTPATTTPGVYKWYISQTVNGCESDRDSITVTIKAKPALPAVTTPVVYCQFQTPVALIATPATGGTLNWYTAATGGTANATAPIPSTAVQGIHKWYVNQTIDGCEGDRDSITVTVNTKPALPVVTTPVTFCQYGVATALNATPVTGAALNWYTVATGGTANATAPTPLTNTPGVYKWYVSQSLTGCESDRDSITVTIIDKPVLPLVTTPVSYCQFNTPLVLSASALPGGTLSWYTAASGGTASATAPTPSTSTAGVYKWYVSQTINGCESNRDSITVTVKAKPALPAVTTPVAYCQFVTPVALVATPATGGTINWYTAATGGAPSGTAPTPSTNTAGVYKWYVSQTINGCEGDRDSITVTIKAKPALPAVTTPVSVCQASAAFNLSATAATGGSLNWYTVATGGTASGTTPSPSTVTAGTFKWYVSQTINGCEGDRDSITVTVKPKPAAPVAGSNSPLCTNPATVLSLTATTVTGASYAWTGPNTFTSTLQNTSIANPAAAASGTYTVTATINGCTSNGGTVSVTVNTTPTPPTVATISYCMNATAVALTATGTNLLWYTQATGGTSSATAPVPSTLVPGTYTWYVSRTTNNCESDRAALVVTIKPLPPVPTVVSPVEYCQTLPTTPLNATPGTGNTLKWYNSSNTLLAGVPTPSSMVLGDFKWYVSQVMNGCEGPKDSILVKVKPVPDAAMIISSDSVCAGDSVLVEFAASAPAVSVITWTASDKADVIGRGPWTMGWTQPGSKIITVQAVDNGCYSKIAYDSVFVKLRPDANFTVSDACEGAKVMVNYNGGNPASGIQYSWTFEGKPGLAKKSNRSYEATWKDGGTYNVSLQTSNGACMSEVVTHAATVHPSPVMVLTESRPEVCYKDTFAVYAEGAVKYTWSPAEAFVNNNDEAGSRMVIMNQPWTIRVTGETPYGCIDSTSLYIKPDICCKDLMVPNAFTPNGDGKNDVFRPLMMGRLSQYAMRITNRFGNVVFESTDPNKGWDGEGYDIGTYFYIIKAKCYDDVDVYKKGDVILIR